MEESKFLFKKLYIQAVKTLMAKNNWSKTTPVNSYRSCKNDVRCITMLLTLRENGLI